MLTIIKNKCGNGGTYLITEMYKKTIGYDIKPRFYHFSKLIDAFNYSPLKEPYLYIDNPQLYYDTYFSGINQLFIDGFYWRHKKSKYIIALLNKYLQENKENNLTIQMSSLNVEKLVKKIINDSEPVIIEVKYPDFDKRKQIISDILKDVKFSLNQDIIDYLAKLKYRHVRLMASIIITIIAQSQIDNINLNNITLDRFIEIFGNKINKILSL